MELTKKEIKIICSNSIERIITMAIRLIDEADGISDNERFICIGDLEQVKPIVEKLWNNKKEPFLLTEASI